MVVHRQYVAAAMIAMATATASAEIMLLWLLQFMMVSFTRADDPDPQTGQTALAGEGTAAD
jgi:hypothetical protein